MRTILLLLLTLIFLNCSEERIFKADVIDGYWKVFKIISSETNGESNNKFFREYFVRFLDNNCGTIDNLDGTWANDIKWVIQENEREDLLFISTALNSNGESSDLFLNTISTFQTFEEMKFSTYYSETDTIGEDVVTTNHYLFFERE